MYVTVVDLCLLLCLRHFDAFVLFPAYITYLMHVLHRLIVSPPPGTVARHVQERLNQILLLVLLLFTRYRVLRTLQNFTPCYCYQPSESQNHVLIVTCWVIVLQSATIPESGGTVMIVLIPMDTALTVLVRVDYGKAVLVLSPLLALLYCIEYED